MFKGLPIILSENSPIILFYFCMLPIILELCSFIFYKLVTSPSKCKGLTALLEYFNVL